MGDKWCRGRAKQCFSFNENKKKTLLKIQISGQGVFFKKKKIYLFVFGCAGSSLVHRLSVVAASGGYSLLGCMGFSLWQSVGLSIRTSVVAAHRFCRTGSAVVVHGLSCPLACGILGPQPGV